MSNYHRYIVIALSSSALAVGTGLSLYAANAFAQQEERVDAALNQLVHEPPTMEDLEASDLHPELKKVIRYGYDLFTNTQQLRGEYVFNDMNCSSCHLGEGRVPFSAPVWAAAITLPDFRGKNQHVNNLEERIAGCFAYSMNGTPPEYGSDEMLALSAYHQWLATGAPMYPISRSMAVVSQRLNSLKHPAMPEARRRTRKTAPFATKKMALGTMKTANMFSPPLGAMALTTGGPVLHG